MVLQLSSRVRKPKITPMESEPPEHALERLYPKTELSPKEAVKLEAAHKAMEAVEQEMESQKKVKEEAVARGTACLPCTVDHLSTCAGLLSDEAVRMAHRNGLNDLEVQRRIMACSDQLNAMEREDLSIEKIAGLPKEEKEIALYAQNKSAEIRHMINGINSIEDLENIALEVKQTRNKVGSDYLKVRLKR
ncbi:MAG: hypothetical protein JRE40_02015 [Deltaproteobacteria bacterium]|nr:hypothetical protein [Deltaproteobacteria bacterium]MBW2672527.1 hypothetical protein [Deltaproteobacteria bacterium]